MKKIFVCTVKIDPEDLSFIFTKKYFDVICDKVKDPYYGVVPEHSDLTTPSSFFLRTMVNTGELRIENFSATGKIFQKYYVWDEMIPPSAVSLGVTKTTAAVLEAFNKEYKDYMEKVIDLAAKFSEFHQGGNLTVKEK